MRLATFENEIPGALVKRGKEYFTEGAVKDLQVMDNGQCFAVVEGTEDYEVDIILDPARQLANQLMEKYKQPRAMKDELGKILTRRDL